MSRAQKQTLVDALRECCRNSHSEWKAGKRWMPPDHRCMDCLAADALERKDAALAKVQAWADEQGIQIPVRCGVREALEQRP